MSHRRVVRVSLVLLFGVASAEASAQMPGNRVSPLNAIGRHWGFGVSDGYHECPEPSHLKPASRAMPIVFQPSAVTQRARQAVESTHATPGVQLFNEPSVIDGAMSMPRLTKPARDADAAPPSGAVSPFAPQLPAVVEAPTGPESPVAPESISPKSRALELSAPVPAGREPGALDMTPNVPPLPSDLSQPDLSLELIPLETPSADVTNPVIPKAPQHQDDPPSLPAVPGSRPGAVDGSQGDLFYEPTGQVEGVGEAKKKPSADADDDDLLLLPDSVQLPPQPVAPQRHSWRPPAAARQAVSPLSRYMSR